MDFISEAIVFEDFSKSNYKIWVWIYNKLNNFGINYDTKQLRSHIYVFHIIKVTTAIQEKRKNLKNEKK